ncbi:MAG: Maf family nucleotide pyrophosphatase [Flavobacteriaceae bacterium]|nr:Maf family nucleotide pyrophosphatase [Flavobacteriaceae bacterium]
MLTEISKKWDIILASKSPRRNQLLAKLGLNFRSITKEVKENYPEHLIKEQITNYLSEKKADAFTVEKPNQLVIAGDTIVCKDTEVLGKPKDKKEAYTMIESLSGGVHEVISSFCIKTEKQKITKSDVVKVYFKELTSDEISYYIDTFSPYDKAGGYGIQEWIGQIGITKIEGSFYTVMGMPVHLIYSSLKQLMM